MKQYLFGLLLLASFGSGLTACKDETKIPTPKTQDVALFFPQQSPDPTKRFFRLQTAQQSDAQLNGNPRPIYEFIIPAFNQRSINVKAVEVYATFRRGTSLSSAPVLVGTYSSFPATVSVNSAEVLDKLMRINTTTGATTSTLVPFRSSNGRYLVFINDAVVFTFEYIRDDDTRIVITPRSYVKLTPGASVNPPGDSIAILSGTQALFEYPLAAEGEFRNN